MKQLCTMSLACLLLASPVLAQTSCPNVETKSAKQIPTIHYKTIKIDGINVFYREAGPVNAPTLLLLHGFPTSSHMFRNLIPLLAERYHVIAPDYPGYGQSDAPDHSTFNYTFANLTTITDKLIGLLKINQFSMYVMDYGAPIGYRLALKNPRRVQALVIQNGNAYTEGLGAFWDPIKAYWADRSPSRRQALAGLVTLETTKFQYTDGVRDTSRISPDNWTIDQALLDRPGNRDIQLDLLGDYGSNVPLYSRADNVMEVLSNADALGVIPDAYRDIKQIDTLLDGARQDQLLKAAKERLQTKLGMRKLPTPEALGAKMESWIGETSGSGYNKADLIDRYLDGIRKVDLATKGEITLDYRNMEIKTIGKNHLSPEQFRSEIESRYHQVFSAAVDEGKRLYDDGKLRYPADMPKQLQIGLHADKAARLQLVAYAESINVREGSGGILSLNRFAYDLNGSMNYVRPDVLLDYGPNKRYWVDGKTSLLAGDAAQYRKFFTYTGASEGKIATQSGLHSVNYDPIARRSLIGGKR